MSGPYSPVTWLAPPGSVWTMLDGVVDPEDVRAYEPTLDALLSEIYLIEDEDGRSVYEDVTHAELRALWPAIEADWRERQEFKAALAVWVHVRSDVALDGIKRHCEAAALRVFAAIDAAVGREQ